MRFSGVGQRGVSRDRRVVSWLVSASVTALFASNGALAQTADNDGDAIALEPLEISTQQTKSKKRAAARTKPAQSVVVTARRIEEPAQAVPFAVTAETSYDLQHQDIEDTQELARRIPNFNHADSGMFFANLTNMRGIGSSSALISPSINYYIDGVPVPARLFDMPFGDVERVEVLRGPQGTLFGLNSQAGAVSIVTGDPSKTFGGTAGVIIGSHGRKEADVTLEGPVTNSVSGRISAKLYDYDGDLTNVLWSAPGVVSSSDEVLRARTYGMLSGKVLFEIDDDRRLTLFGNWSRDRQNPTTGMWLDDPGFPRNALNPIPELETEAATAGAKYEQNLGWARFTSISAITGYDTKMEADIVDGFLGQAQSGAPGFMLQAPGLNVRRIDEDSAQLSQELRLDGATAGVRWVAGLSALWSNFDSTTDITSLALANGSYRGQIETTNLAAFGEVTVPLAQRLNWIGGLRLSYESKDFDGQFLGRNGARPQFDEAGNVDYLFLTGRTGLSYEFADNLTAFATVARGEKTGGYLFYNQFAALGVPLQPYGSSTTWSYEAGVKGSRLAGGNVDVATSVFYNDTADEQLFTFNPVLGRFSVQNADTRTYGAELEAVVRPMRGLSVGTNLALLNTEITSGSALILGNDVPYAPSFSSMLFAEYRWSTPISGNSGETFVRAEYGYTSSRMIDPANSRKLSSYELVNLRAGWQGERFEVFGAVENLLDENYATSGFQAGTDTSGRPVFAGISGEGRAYMIGARTNF